jgi:hypothetical protein
MCAVFQLLAYQQILMAVGGWEGRISTQEGNYVPWHLPSRLPCHTCRSYYISGPGLFFFLR